MFSQEPMVLLLALANGYQQGSDYLPHVYPHKYTYPSQCIVYIVWVANDTL